MGRQVFCFTFTSYERFATYASVTLEILFCIDGVSCFHLKSQTLGGLVISETFKIIYFFGFVSVLWFVSHSKNININILCSSVYIIMKFVFGFKQAQEDFMRMISVFAFIRLVFHTGQICVMWGNTILKLTISSNLNKQITKFSCIASEALKNRS